MYIHLYYRLQFATEATADQVPVPTPSQCEYANTGEGSRLWNPAALFSLQVFHLHQPPHHPSQGSNPCRRLQISPCARLWGVITPVAASGAKPPMKLWSRAPAPAGGVFMPRLLRPPVPVAVGCPQGHRPLSHHPGTGCPIPHVGVQNPMMPSKTGTSAPGPALPLLRCGMWAITSTIQLLQKKGAYSLPQSPLMETPLLLHPSASAHFFHRLERDFSGGRQSLT